MKYISMICFSQTLPYILNHNNPIIHSQEPFLNTTQYSSRWLFLYSPPTQTVNFTTGASMKERRGKEVEKSHRDGTLNYVFFIHFNNNSHNLYEKERRIGLRRTVYFQFSLSRVLCHTVNIQENRILLCCYDKGNPIFLFYVI